MAIDNNDTTESAKDVVKSQLASAYEDGVTGYGDIPETTTIPDKQYVVEATDVYDPYGPSITETSPDINDKRIQTIASLSLSQKEIDRMKDLLEARTLEDALTAAIVYQVVDQAIGFGTDLMKDYVQEKVEALTNSILSSEDVLKALTALGFTLDRMETFMTKGTLLKNAKAQWLALSMLVKPFSLTSHAGNISRKRWDPGFYDEEIRRRKSVYPQYNTFVIPSSTLVPVDFHEHISNIVGPDVTTADMKTKTVSTLIMQGLHDAEIAMDYGVTPRFMREACGVHNGPRIEAYSDAESQGLYTSQGYTNDYQARHYMIHQYTHHSAQNDDAKFAPLANIFHKYGHMDSDGRKAFSKWALTDAPLPGASSYSYTGGRSPIHVIPNVVEQMSPIDSLLYLSTIIAREFSLSRGVADATQIKEPFTGGDLVGGDLGPTNLYNFDYTKPLARHIKDSAGSTSSNAKIGKTLLGASSYSKPVFDYPANNSTAAACLVVPASDPFDPTYKVMPYEMIDREMDLHDGEMRIGSNYTLKDMIIDPILNSPENIDEIVDSTAEVLNRSTQRYNENVRLFTELNKVRLIGAGNVQGIGLGDQQGFVFTHASPRFVLSKVMHLFGEQLVQSMNTTGQATSSGNLCRLTVSGNNNALEHGLALIYLTHFMKPNGHPDETQHHRYLKQVFIHRCFISAVQDAGQNDSIHGMDIDPTQVADSTEKYGFMPLSAKLPDSNFLNYELVTDSAFGTRMKSLYNSYKNLHRDTDESGDFNTDMDKSVWNTIVQSFVTLSERQSAMGSEPLTPPEIVSYNGPDFSGEAVTDIKEAFEALGKFPGFHCQVTGETVIDKLMKGDMGTDVAHQYSKLITDVNSVVDYLIKGVTQSCMQSGLAGFPADSDSQTDRAARHFTDPGVSAKDLWPFGRQTIANGLDRPQLTALVLEMFLILADEFLDATSVMSYVSSNLSTAYGLSNAEAADNQITLLNFWWASPHVSVGFWDGDEASLDTFDTYTHYLRVLPKSELKSGTGYRGADGKVFLSLEELGTVIKRYASALTMKKYMKPISYGEFFNEMTGEGSTIQAEIQGSGAVLSENINLGNMHSMIRQAGREGSGPHWCLEPSDCLMAYIKQQTLNFRSQGLVGGISAAEAGTMIEDIKEKVEEIPDQIMPFIKNMTVDQINNARSRHLDIGVTRSTLSSMLFGPGYSTYEEDHYIPSMTKNGYLDKAAKIFLDYLSEEGWEGKILFFGMPPGLAKQRRIGLASNSASISLQDGRSLRYKIAFERNSELSSLLDFQQNFENFEKFYYDSSFYLPRESIFRAMTNSTVNTFDEIVENAEFRVAASKNSPHMTGGSTFGVKTDKVYHEITGFDLLSTHNSYGYSQNELRDTLRNILISEMLKYVYERCTELSVSETSLSSRPARYLSRLGMIKMLHLANASHIPDRPGPFRLDMPYSRAEKIIDALFEQVPASILSEHPTLVSDPVRIKTNKEELKEAFEPQLVREGPNAHFVDPVVSRDIYLLVQALSKSALATPESLQETIFTKGLFDLVIAVPFKIPEGMSENAYTVLYDGETLPSIDESVFSNFNSQMASAIESGAASSEADLVNRIVNGSVKIDNYRPIFEISLN